MAGEQRRTMKAVARDRYGLPDVLELQEVDEPELAADGVLVRMHAASVNRLDWYDVTGTPLIARPTTGIRRPRGSRLIGVDFAGTVEAVGEEVTDLQPGEEVFGGRSGAFAEYVSAPREKVARKPSSLTFEEAATVPVAALTALQGLRDHGRLRPGHQVLVNGASGGVGTFAVQIAKALEADVTAVCSTRNVEQARALGADHVVDYTLEDFTRSDRRYDVILDVAGNRSWSEYKRVLSPDARLVIVGGPHGAFLGPLGHIAAVKLAALRGSRKAVFFVARLNEADLDVVGEMLESGKVKPVVEKRYELGQAAEAIRYMGEGHVRGKLVIVPGS